MTSNIEQKVRRTKDDSDEQALLFIAFWLSVLIECLALYKREYIMYGIARMFVVPIILIRTFKSQASLNIGFYFYTFLGLSFLADTFTTFGNYTIACIGYSIYTLSYLSIRCWFQKLTRPSNTVNIIFVTTLLILILTNIFWFYTPELHKETLIILIGIHFIMLIYVLFEALNSRKVLGKANSTKFIWGLIVIIISNVVCALDILYFHQAYSWIDSIVVLGNGIYIFILTRGVLFIAKRRIKLIK